MYDHSLTCAFCRLRGPPRSPRIDTLLPYTPRCPPLAVARLMSEPPYMGAVPICIGDDVTDEYGFAAAAAAVGYGILVGAPRPTAAHYRLPGTREVYNWLGL